MNKQTSAKQQVSFGIDNFFEFLEIINGKTFYLCLLDKHASLLP